MWIVGQSASECVRGLIRADEKKHNAAVCLEALLVEGLQSAEAESTAARFDAAGFQTDRSAAI
jgi:Arc/MetJ-type ribon-helix-helix transcriptional regulator